MKTIDTINLSSRFYKDKYMQQLPNLQFFYNKDSETLDIILHGVSEGMESTFIQKLVKKSKESKHSTVTFNFPFLDRKESNSSSPELKEELNTLNSVLSFINADYYKNINLIAKSFGGIVASYFLRDLPLNQHNRYSITILGYVIGNVDLKTFTGKIRIIQGQMDRFGDIEAVKKDLKSAISKNIDFIEIPKADHSYRDPDTKESKFEDIAINEVIL